MSRHLCQASRARGGICLTPCWRPEKGRCAWVLGVYFAGKHQASRLPSKAKTITPRYLLWISSTVERKGLCLPPNNWLRQTLRAEAGASVAKPGAAACVCCLPWGAVAWAPWSCCGQAHPPGFRGQLCGGPREAPLFLAPCRKPGSRSINHTPSPGGKDSPQRGAQHCPNGTAGASQERWGLLHPPTQDLGEEGCLGHPYQALRASVGTQWEQAVQPREGAQGDVSPTALQPEAGTCAAGAGQPQSIPGSDDGRLWGHALPSPPCRGHSPLETHQSSS